MYYAEFLSIFIGVDLCLCRCYSHSLPLTYRTYSYSLPITGRTFCTGRTSPLIGKWVTCCLRCNSSWSAEMEVPRLIMLNLQFSLREDSVRRRVTWQTDQTELSVGSTLCNYGACHGSGSDWKHFSKTRSEEDLSFSSLYSYAFIADCIVLFPTFWNSVLQSFCPCSRLLGSLL